MTTTIFFLPGLRGDEDKALDFRALFGRDVRFEVLGFPELSAPASVLVNIAVIAKRSAEEIERKMPEGDLWVIGFSFGGCVAFEACQALVERGRRIAFLGLIDAPLQPFGYLWQGPPAKQARNLMAASLRLLTGREWILRSALAATGRLWPTKLSGLHWFLTGFIRRQAVSRWRPRPLRLDRSVVVISESFFARTVHHWQRLLPAATVSYIPVEHHTVLDENSLDAVFSSFATAVPEYRPHNPGADRDVSEHSERRRAPIGQGVLTGKPANVAAAK